MPLHPQVQSFLDELAELDPPGWETLPPTESRAMFAGFTDLFGEGPPLPRVEDRTIADRIPVRIYAATESASLPAVFYFHGGGWVLGDLDTHDALCRRLAAASGCAVIAVDYRRSPEAVFPAALDDGYDAIQTIANESEAFGIDRERIVVAGDSAGGNLAAALALRSRDDDGVPVKLQVLIYPVLEPRFDTASYRQFASGFGLTMESMRWFWRQYLSSSADENEPLASPIRAGSLADLPPAHVVTAEYDVLRDEGEAFAEKLSAAGVPVTVKRYEGMIHGFVHFSGAFDMGLQAIEDIAARIKESL